MTHQDECPAINDRKAETARIAGDERGGVHAVSVTRRRGDRDERGQGGVTG